MLWILPKLRAKYGARLNSVAASEGWLLHVEAFIRSLVCRKIGGASSEWRTHFIDFRASFVEFAVYR